jgi:hypothetical protein
MWEADGTPVVGSGTANPQPLFTSTPAAGTGRGGESQNASSESAQPEGTVRHGYVDVTDMRIQHLTELLENEKRAVRLLSHFSNLGVGVTGSSRMDLDPAPSQPESSLEMPVLETMVSGGLRSNRNEVPRSPMTAEEVYNKSWSFERVLNPERLVEPVGCVDLTGECVRRPDVVATSDGNAAVGRSGTECEGKKGPDRANRPLGGAVPRMKPSRYDGLTPYEDYRVQFDMLAELNGWSKEVKALYLAGCLNGSARSVLNDIGAGDRYEYDKLDKALKERFGTDDQSELFKAKLRNRTKTKDESLQELAHDIRRLVRLAYPQAALSTYEGLTKDQFIEALGDSEVRWSVFQARPRNITEALKIALELEAFRESEKCRIRRSIRGVTVEPGGSKSESEVSMEERREKLWDKSSQELQGIVAQIQQLHVPARGGGSFGNESSSEARSNRMIPVVVPQQGPRYESSKGDRSPAAVKAPFDISRIKCFRCDQMGHYARDCPDLPRRGPPASRKDALNEQVLNPGVGV